MKSLKQSNNLKMVDKDLKTVDKKLKTIEKS